MFNKLKLLLLLITLLKCSLIYEEPVKNKKIKIHKDFNKEQIEAIILAINKWNEFGQKYVGYDLIQYDGIDTRDFNINHLNDNINTIYYINTTPNVEMGTFLAYVPYQSDIMFLKDRMEKYYTKTNYYWITYNNFIKFTALHELGHFIGIGPIHINQLDDSIIRNNINEKNVMSSAVRTNFEFSEDDIKLLCEIYKCKI